MTCRDDTRSADTIALTLTVQRGPDALRISPSGDLDLATCDVLVDEVARLMQATDRLLILNFADVPFCDSSGIKALIRIRRQCDANDTRLQLTNLPHNVHLVLVEFAGLGNHLGVQEPGHPD